MPHLAGNAGTRAAHGGDAHAPQVRPQHARRVRVAGAAGVLRRGRRPVRRHHLHVALSGSEQGRWEEVLRCGERVSICCCPSKQMLWAVWNPNESDSQLCNNDTCLQSGAQVITNLQATECGDAGSIGGVRCDELRDRCQQFPGKGLGNTCDHNR